jgi:hypothetical protein
VIEIDDGGSIERAAELLRGLPGAINKVSRKAARAAIKGIKKEAVNQVSEHYTIQRGRIGKNMRARLKGMGAEFIARGPVNDLSYFKHNPRSVPRRRPPAGTYLYSQVVKGQGGTIAHAFLAKMRSGHVGVFRRTAGNKSLPIAKLSGPSTPQMLENPVIRSYLEKQMADRFTQAIEAGTAEALGGKS